MSDTIYAQSTPTVRSAIAVFRLSGPDAGGVATSLLNKVLRPRQMELVEIKNPDTAEVIDIGLAVWFPRPSSFTGEDILEIHTHGGLAICREMLGLFSRIPRLRLAEPGEFTRRAFENGKLDLSSVEALSDLINADTQYDRRRALHRMFGGFHDYFESWRLTLIDIRALLEASLDFSDEGDLRDNPEKEVASKLSGLLNEISAAITRTEQYHSGKEGYQILVAGPPNAGKSSLVNYLAKKRVAIVSDAPGTTRDLIEVKLEVEGYPIVLIDSAGLRSSQDQIESIGMDIARDRARNVDMILWLGDAVVGAQEFEHLKTDMFCIASKCDVLKANDERLNVSVLTGEGIDKLLEILCEKAKTKLGEFESGGVLFARQLQTTNSFKKHVHGAINNLTLGFPEICALDLENAASALSSVTDHISHDDLLDSIFSQFCLGK